MRPKDSLRSQELITTINSFNRVRHPLPGIQNQAAFGTFIEQLLESIHRAKYVQVLKTRNLSPRSADPGEEIFDPVKAAILHHMSGNIDEAFWMVFLLTHFGKHKQAGWVYVRQLYGRCGEYGLWDWETSSTSPTEFRKWLYSHRERLGQKGMPSGFGNHRKYESLDAYSARGTGAVVESYVNWVGPSRKHKNLIDEAYQQSAFDPKKAFDYLFHSMSAVVSFGRTAKFDYLTMVGQLGLADIEPGSAYLEGSTGPIRGARLLFGGDKKAKIGVKQLEFWLNELDEELDVGMRVLEDALCNWQKSPRIFRRFRG